MKYLSIIYQRQFNIVNEKFKLQFSDVSYFFYLNMCVPTRITTKLVEFYNAVDHIPLVETVLFDR